jgi:hypothetical protein
LPNSSFGTARLLYGPDPRRNSQQKKLCTEAGVLESSLILGLVGRGLARDLGTSTRPDPSPPPNSWLVVASRFRHQTMTRLHERPSKNSSPLPFQNNESTSNVPVPRPPREAKHALPSRAPPNPARGAPFHRFDPGTHATKQKPTSQDTQVPHRAREPRGSGSRATAQPRRRRRLFPRSPKHALPTVELLAAAACRSALSFRPLALAKNSPLQVARRKLFQTQIVRSVVP